VWHGIVFDMEDLNMWYNLMTEDDFVSYINHLRSEYVLVHELYKFGIEIDCLSHRKSTEVLTKQFFGNDLEFIEWWLYDSPNGIKEDCYTEVATVIVETEGKQLKVVINTPSDLYNFLVS
jgi:hypothetical protein